MGAAVDNDFFSKFEMCGLLDEVLGALGVTRDQCFRLASLVYALEGKKFRKSLGDETCKKLVAPAKTIPILPDLYHEVIERLVRESADAAGKDHETNAGGEQNKIDPGEAHLIAHVAATDGLLFATHDKRALVAVSRIEGMAETLRSRVVVVEMGCLLLCKKLGVATSRQRLDNLLKRDTGLRAIFASEKDDQVLVGLRSYIDDIKRRSDAAMFWEPPEEAQPE